MLNGLAHVVGESVELGVDPLLEAGEMRVALGEPAMVLQQRTQMLGLLARHRVETFVGHGNAPVAQTAKQFLHLR